jgi:hypothetical protein
VKWALLPWLVALVALVALAACDPVHADAIAALGGETPGVRPGPMHRPGQPCVLCHDSGGKSPQMSVAGTVFESQSSAEGVTGVAVVMSDSAGSTYSATTNAAGNFFVTASEWTPTYPILSTQLQVGNVTVVMYSEIGRNGSCGGCHSYPAPAGPSSPGRVSVVPP